MSSERFETLVQISNERDITDNIKLEKLVYGFNINKPAEVKVINQSVFLFFHWFVGLFNFWFCNNLYPE